MSPSGPWPRSMRRSTSACHERQLTGVFMEAMARAGVTTPSNQDVAWITSREHPWRRADRDAPVAAGDLVVFEAGVIGGGYVGELSRTRLVGGASDGGAAADDLFRRADALWDRLLPPAGRGAPMSDLLDAYDAAGEPPPPMPVARGLGLGFDLPLVTARAPADRGRAAVRGRHGLRRWPAYVWQAGRRRRVPAGSRRDHRVGPRPSCRRNRSATKRGTHDRHRGPGSRGDHPLREGSAPPGSPRSRSIVPTSSTARRSAPAAGTATSSSRRASTTT